MPHTAIFREPTAAEAELSRLRAHLAALRTTLTSRELALGDLRDQLTSFEGRYLRQVGTLYRQLDEWEQKIAELQAKHYHGTAPAFTPNPEPETQNPNANPLNDPLEAIDLKALFRELAKRIHPDFATDDLDATRRTRLMAQANDAYLREDAAVLLRMLNGFDPATGHTSEEAVEAELARTTQLIQQVQHDIATAETELEAAAHSDSSILQQRCIDAALKGRDLLAEMAARVHGSIGLAMRRYELDLDRIKNPPRGFDMESLLSVATPTTRRIPKRR